MLIIKKYKQTIQSLLIILFILLLWGSFSHAAFAGSVFEDKKKTEHQLSDAQLNKITTEHQLKFPSDKGPSYKASNSSRGNPWQKKKQKQPLVEKKFNWGECRDYALHKRNRCYREGSNAYSCEQVYEVRVKLCDDDA